MRSCDGCTLCCEELATVTPSGVACDHQCAAGCAIYEERPDPCRTFECGWLQGLIDEQYKPDLVGWFLNVRENKTPQGTMRVGFAMGPDREGQREAVKPGFVIVSQDGQVFAANKDDETKYLAISDLIARMRSYIRKGRQAAL